MAVTIPIAIDINFDRVPDNFRIVDNDSNLVDVVASFSMQQFNVVVVDLGKLVARFIVNPSHPTTVVRTNHTVVIDNSIS